ncbi:MAG: hypothetical protein IPF82_04795 [Blastocatellia bacterium]|nr:hypothetical protein [Blastocatellia bacterium]
MSNNAWRILLFTFVGSPLAAVLSNILGDSVTSPNGVLSGLSFLRGDLLHEAPFVFSVLPAFIAVAALFYVGGLLMVRGRDAMPERPRLVTWLILANFLVPIGSFAVMFATLSLEN